MSVSTRPWLKGLVPLLEQLTQVSRGAGAVRGFHGHFEDFIKSLGYPPFTQVAHTHVTCGTGLELSGGAAASISFLYLDSQRSDKWILQPKFEAKPTACKQSTGKFRSYFNTYI